MFLGETGSTEEAACSSCPFFDASVVRYPSSYTYPTTYETRSLTAVAGYVDGTSMFTTLDISSFISSDWKYAGGVLGPNGLIYFIPYNADNVGILNPSSSSSLRLIATRACTRLRDVTHCARTGLQTTQLPDLENEQCKDGGEAVGTEACCAIGVFSGAGLGSAGYCKDKYNMD